jgi:hypothetical protein
MGCENSCVKYSWICRRRGKGFLCMARKWDTRRLSVMVPVMAGVKILSKAQIILHSIMLKGIARTFVSPVWISAQHHHFTPAVIRLGTITTFKILYSRRTFRSILDETDMEAFASESEWLKSCSVSLCIVRVNMKSTSRTEILGSESGCRKKLVWRN